MGNPFFNPESAGMPNIMQMVQQLKQNPMQFLANSRLRIPPNIGNNGDAILNYLVQSGQFSQQQINNAYQTASKMGFKK